MAGKGRGRNGRGGGRNNTGSRRVEIGTRRELQLTVPNEAGESPHCIGGPAGGWRGHTRFNRAVLTVVVD